MILGFFVIIIIQAICLIGGIVFGAWGCFRIIKIIWYRDWEYHTVVKLVLPIVALLALSAFLLFAWNVGLFVPRIF